MMTARDAIIIRQPITCFLYQNCKVRKEGKGLTQKQIRNIDNLRVREGVIQII